MGNPEKKPIVFISNLTPEWLESGLRLAACGIERDPWKEQMAEIIGQTSKGAENIRKSLRYLRHIYIEPTEYTELRAEAFILYHSSTELKREKIISWGLAILTYPFLNEVSATLGRLLRVQNDVKLEQFIRKLTDTYGEKETVVRSGTRCLKLIVEEEFLLRSSLGFYSLPPTLKIQDQKLAAWLLKIWFILNSNQSPADRTALSNHPALVFFDAPSLIEAGLRTGAVSLDRMSFSQDTIILNKPTSN